MIEVALTIPDIPPSMNDIVGQGTRWRYTFMKKKWGRLLEDALNQAGMVRCQRVTVEGIVTFPTRARHDQGNYRFMLEKALGDALQAGAFLADDSWAFYEFNGLAARYERGVRRTDLLLFPESVELAA
jgi:hypothetical protein